MSHHRDSCEADHDFLWSTSLIIDRGIGPFFLAHAVEFVYVYSMCLLIARCHLRRGHPQCRSWDRQRQTIKYIY